MIGVIGVIGVVGGWQRVGVLGLVCKCVGGWWTSWRRITRSESSQRSQPPIGSVRSASRMYFILEKGRLVTYCE